MSTTFSATGGARIGWINATWPFATLTATPDSLRVNVKILGEYEFTPDQIISITRYTMIPILGWGIRIQHCASDYPQNFIFWYLGSPETLLTGIREVGFEPRAQPSAALPYKGGPIRWQAIIAAFVLWNGLFLLFALLQTPSTRWLFSAVPPLAVILLLIAILRLPPVQRLILKPGRNVGEIRPFLNLLLFICSLAFVILTLVGVSGGFK